jgi:hypothetical protein
MKINKMGEKIAEKIKYKKLINKIYKINQKIIQNSEWLCIIGVINIIWLKNRILQLNFSM